MTKQQIIEKWAAELELLVQNGDLVPKDFVIDLLEVAEKWGKGSFLLADLITAQQEIISSPIRFNGVAIEDIKRIFADYGIKYEPQF